ncbi:Protein FAM164A [Papilio xuthus]|uniref:Protein FAM164A n=1 Tax=Papilio xuthus TaxID=66420 RepID=A0A194PU74_PAPXU|nr:Protein FAM164A [Papilio xuthus]
MSDFIKLSSAHGKRKQEEVSAKSSRSASPEPAGDSSPCESYRPLLRTPPPSHVGPPPSPPVPTSPVAPVAPQPAGPLPLMPCPVCARTFVPQSLAKHVKICEKTMAKRRKTFDSSRQRREGTDLEQYLPKNFGLPENSPFLEKSPPNTAKPTPKPKPQSVRSTIKKPTAELQRCPHCSRAFGVRAFERHVEWCADKAKILPAAAAAPPPPHIADAKQRLNARTQYKAPLARGRKSSQSRDKTASRSTSVDSSRGISPPPPREFGDYKQGRTRASESMSSNDCHEDSAPHVPVIRNSRTTQNNSGDANVKARQARLARDISSTRNSRNSKCSLQSNADPILTNKPSSSNLKNRVNVKKKQQLKKLEEITNKYNERKEKIIEEKSGLSKLTEDSKSQIPVIKKTVLQKRRLNKTTTNSSELGSLKEDDKDTLRSAQKLKVDKRNPSSTRKQNDKPEMPKTKKHNVKESTMSLDSLDDVQSNKSNNKNCQSIGINTELFCPSIPCKIYSSQEQAKEEKKKTKYYVKELNMQKNSNSLISDTSVELLYKNPKMEISYDMESKEISESQLDLKEVTHNNTDLQDAVYVNETEKCSNNSLATTVSTNEESRNKETENKFDEINNSFEEFEENNNEHDLSAEIFNDSVEDFRQPSTNNEMSRHGSGDTYTKITEGPTELEEFFNITDEIINSKTAEDKFDKDMDGLHTPNTISIEALNKTDLQQQNVDKHEFSDALEELKSDLKDILIKTTDVNSDDTKTNRHDMEHITVFELKFYEKEFAEEIQTLEEVKPKLKLPSISETNNLMTKEQSHRKLLKTTKSSKKYKSFNKETRNSIENKTFIVNEHQGDNSDAHSISSEAPPLKLPKIEKKRLDDNYDPFASAARQMKELMSSDTNIPKKMQTSTKELNKTLPVLRPNKDKMSHSHLTNNTKLMKDTLNKTYQKTPTLQRMKSFGSPSNENKSTFGGRCSSFRINRNDKNSSQKLNTTFTKSSKENISTPDRTNFNRTSNLNRSFSNYSSNYNSPKLKDKIPKIAPSMYHSFQRTTIKQPLKLDKIKNDEDRKNFVNLDSILSYDNSSMTDSNYIDPRLINENDNLPINVTTILNNPDIISSMESLLTTENLPAKFDSFNFNDKNNKKSLAQIKNGSNKNNNTNNTNAPSLNDLNSQYEKFMSSLEQSINSKTSVRDDESLCEDFDLEEFMTSFDEEVNKQKTEKKRTYSSTTRVVKQSDIFDTHKTSSINGESTPIAKNVNNNGMIPVNKSMSLVFSNNNVKGENLFPSSVKRSTSLLDSIQKRGTLKADTSKNRHKADLLEQDIMQSLKDFDKFYESERIENNQPNKELISSSKNVHNTTKKESRMKIEKKNNKNEQMSNGHFSPGGKPSNDSAYSSLNRISPSKLSLCNSKEPTDSATPERSQAGSESVESHKDEVRSISSEEFLAMERSAEMSEPVPKIDAQYKDLGSHTLSVLDISSRASSQRSGVWRSRQELSSSGSESSVHAEPPPARLSRFCHECGSRFPVDSAKFCIECGVRRLLV